MIYSSSISFPYIFSTSSGKTMVDTTFESINTKLSLLLQTAYLELLGNPDFGCGLYEITFDYAHESSYDTIKDMIVDAVARFETDIVIEKEDITIYQDKETNHIKITIRYKMRNTDLYSNTDITLGVE